MCLYLRDKIERVATSNIYVWKGLESSIGFYYSPVFSYRYDLGKTYKSELDRNEGSIVVSKGLHSFGYNVKISNPYDGRYECYGISYNHLLIL